MNQSTASHQPIVGYHQDAEGVWVAQLACGHGRHIRHDPPFQNRGWVLEQAGRDARLGVALLCKRCLADEPPLFVPRTVVPSTGRPLVVHLAAGDDLHLLDRVAADVFDGPVMPDRWAEFLADPRHHLAVALADDEVIGMASALHYVHPDKPPELWINEVSVTPAWQQQGVATTLLTALFAQARALGCTAAWVLTEIDNYAARRLYASAGGEEEEPRPALSVFDLGL